VSKTLPYLLTFDQLCVEVLNVSPRTARTLKKTDPAFPKAVLVGMRNERYLLHEGQAYASSRPRVADMSEPPELTAARARRAAGIPPSPLPQPPADTTDGGVRD
jgi:hypothetical protein